MNGPSIKVLDRPDGMFEVVVYDGGDLAADICEECELQGGGYTWQAILEAVVRMHLQVVTREQVAPQPILLVRHGSRRVRLTFGAEGDTAFVAAIDKAVVEELATHARAVATDRDRLLEALARADEELLE
ncbi:hypothetical protein ACFL6C_00690 [Myxococcota bacterium]